MLGLTLSALARSESSARVSKNRPPPQTLVDESSIAKLGHPSVWPVIILFQTIAELITIPFLIVVVAAAAVQLHKKCFRHTGKA